MPSATKISGSKSNLGLIFGIVGGAICGAVLVGSLGFVIFRKMRNANDEEATRSIFEKTNVGKSFVHVAPRRPSDASEKDRHGFFLKYSPIFSPIEKLGILF